MPFSFLNPLLWFGALAVGVPIWLHLRRKQERNLLRFTTVRFLEDQPEPRRSPLRPRDLLLLALRALAVLLVVGAFSWPFLPGIDTVPVVESRVYILDNTLSHQANGGFERSRDRIVTELKRARSDVQIGVVELTSAPRVLASFGDSRETAVENVRNLQASFERGSYLAAFRQANSVLANSLGRRKRIVFLGDNQANQWNEGVNTPAFLRNVEVEIPTVSDPLLLNVALADARVQRIFLGDRSLVNFSVRLNHTGPAKAAKLILRANDQTVFTREVPLADQPETILVHAQWEAEPAAAIGGDISLESDADNLPADNRVYFSLAPVTEGKVALLAQSPYLRVALSPEIMRGEWETRVVDPAALGQEIANEQDADVLCLESSYLQSGDARTLLQRYLSNGRGVLLLLNRSTPAVEACLRQLGFETEGNFQAESEPDKFQFVMSNHPVFHPFLSPDFGNLMEISVREYVRLKAPEAIPLIFSERGAGLFFQGARTQGKLFVSAFGLDREHSSWPVHQSFIPFLDLALQAARAQDPLPASFEPGEIANLQFPKSFSGREVVLRGDDGEHVRAAVEQGRARVRIPARPGLYHLTVNGENSYEKLISVNPPGKESQLVFTDPRETVQVWRMPSTTVTRDPAVAKPQVRLAGVLQQHLWWWMLIGGLAVLLVETGWAAVKKVRA